MQEVEDELFQIFPSFGLSQGEKTNCLLDITKPKKFYQIGRKDVGWQSVRLQTRMSTMWNVPSGEQSWRTEQGWVGSPLGLGPQEGPSIPERPSNVRTGVLPWAPTTHTQPTFPLNALWPRSLTHRALTCRVPSSSPSKATVTSPQSGQKETHLMHSGLGQEPGAEDREAEGCVGALSQPLGTPSHRGSGLTLDCDLPKAAQEMWQRPWLQLPALLSSGISEFPNRLRHFYSTPSPSFPHPPLSGWAAGSQWCSRVNQKLLDFALEWAIIPLSQGYRVSLLLLDLNSCRRLNGG